MHASDHSRSQVPDCHKHGLIKFVHSSPFQPPIEYLAYVTTGYPKLDVISFVGHRVLADVNQKSVVANVEAYPYHRQEETGSTESGLGWWKTTGILCKIQTLDDYS